MIKTIALSISLIFISSFVQADQLEWLTKEQAEAAKTLLEEKVNATLWCGCCDEDLPQDIRIKTVVILKVDGEDKYEVHVTFENPTGESTSEVVDLAYIWVNHNGKSKTVGEVLKFKHDPCKRL